MDGTQPELFFGESEYVAPGSEELPDVSKNAADVIDMAATSEPAIVKSDDDDEPLNKGFGRRRRKNPEEPKAGPPNIDEWMDFFSRIVIRFLTEWYVDLIFRGIDEDDISDRDAAKLLLTEEERNTIARPFAEYANKNPYMRKHGRQIVAFADSFESVVMLGRWFARVNRVAKKYKPRKQNVRSTVQRMGANGNGSSGESAESTANGSHQFSVFNPGGS
jgi:hypothetical protein